MKFRWSHGLLVLLFLALLAFILTLQLLSPSSAVIYRYPGGSKNPFVKNKGPECKAHDPASWGYGACSVLINCTLNKLDEIEKSDAAIGTTILGLLPSIMLTAAAQPEEILKLSLVSPVRAVATAAFSVGYSPAIFTRLKPIGAGPNGDPELTWIISLAHLGDKRSPTQLILKIIADIAIVASAGIMLWQTWTVNSAVLVQWLCHSPLMIFTWPLVSMVWVFVAILLLCGMAEDIRFLHSSKDEEYSWWQVLKLPYNLDVERTIEPQPESQTTTYPNGTSRPSCKTPITVSSAAPITLKIEAPTTIASNNIVEIPPDKPIDVTFMSDILTQNIGDHSIRVKIKMPYGSTFRSWDTYFFIIEGLAICIYFYATFVLLSSLFIGAVGSVKFAATVAGLYFGVRVIGALL